MYKSIQIAAALNDKRLERHPDHPFFVFGKKEIDAIKAELGRKSEVSADFYKNTRIGMMCAKELENIDMEYCNAVYDMLEEIRPKT